MSNLTSPISFVQVGMKFVCPDDSATWWEVEEIICTESPMAQLRSNDARRMNWPCSDIRRRFKLYEDFDSALSHPGSNEVR